MKAQSGTESQTLNNQVLIRVWEIPVRVFHWLLFLSFVIAWVTAEEVAWLHQLSGYTIACLIAFRLVWGFVGNEYARFGSFLYHPTKILRFLLDTIHLRAKRYIGHNPAGGAMAILLLLTLILIVVTGQMMTMDYWWGSESLEDVHEAGANGALMLVFLHLAGVLIASIEHKENLVRAMVSGVKKSH